MMKKIKMLYDLQAMSFDLRKDNIYEITFEDDDVLYVLDSSNTTVGIEKQCVNDTFVYIEDEESGDQNE